jgi:peptidoglycan lytic transglycosylase G
VTAPRRRRPPARSHIVRRRLLAILAIVAALAAVGWGAARLAADVRGGDARTRPEPTRTRGTDVVVPTLRIVFPEGFTRREMAERIAAVNVIARQRRKVSTRLRPSSYLRLTGDSAFPRSFPGAGRTRSLEGFLFPALYEFTPTTPTRRLIRDQLDAFEENWRKVDLRYAKSKNLTSYDVLVIASMIEEEAVVPSERRLIASVIYNRLRRRMPLGIDATIRYGLGVPPTQPLRDSQLRSDNPYNTRLRLGLPPTPISNPGLASIRAAAHPARTDYLYFVRKPDKRHHYFTASEADFYRKACDYGYAC